MEKTLYYSVEIKEIGAMINQGFIIVKINNGEIISLEGVFTRDYLVAEIEKDNICFKYYSRYEEIGDYEEEWEILMALTDFELPINLEAHIETEYEQAIFQIKTLRPIVEQEKKQRCESILEELKNNNVFTEGRN